MSKMEKLEQRLQQGWLAEGRRKLIFLLVVCLFVLLVFEIGFYVALNS